MTPQQIVYTIPCMGYRKSDDVDRNHGFAVDAPATRSKLVTLRIDPELLARLQDAAAHEDRTLSAFLRVAAIERADRALMLNRRTAPGAKRR